LSDHVYTKEGPLIYESALSCNQPVFIYKNLYGTSGPTIFISNAGHHKACVYNS